MEFKSKQLRGELHNSSFINEAKIQTDRVR